MPSLTPGSALLACVSVMSGVSTSSKVGDRPAGRSAASTVTVRAMSCGSPTKKYSPSALVVVVRVIVDPSPGSSHDTVTSTPAMPGSPASWTPSVSTSNQMRLPRSALVGVRLAESSSSSSGPTPSSWLPGVESMSHWLADSTSAMLTIGDDELIRTTMSSVADAPEASGDASVQASVVSS